MKNIFAAVSAVTVIAGGLSLASVSPADAQSRGAPRGSYAQSCSSAYVNQGRLYADCRDTRGQLRSTSIRLDRCMRDDIANMNGLLTCGSFRGDFENSRPGRPDDNRPGRPDDNRPGGNWNNGRGASITVYRDSQYRGQAMTFDREITNLRQVGMNDAISSIRLSRGSWEVCEDANFRGRCVVIRDDTRDLVRMGWNDKISSMRPVGRR